ncbi:hypothetical protein WME73_07110 [Sorangium sp. So ce302]|uniref:hypothetical protein n=1 Tax=Sorangium sp. So ce302 TaxID=3133297 RepID=UPI003F5F3C30
MRRILRQPVYADVTFSRHSREDLRPRPWETGRLSGFSTPAALAATMPLRRGPEAALLRPRRLGRRRLT